MRFRAGATKATPRLRRVATCWRSPLFHLPSITVRQFIYDPRSGKKPPAGFEDLPKLGKDAPGLIGLPLPAKPASTISWDRIVDSLILCRVNDQAVGQLVVT